MKKLFLLSAIVVLSFSLQAQQVIWDTIISFGPGKDIPAYIYPDDGNIFYIVGYTENTSNATTDPFVYYMDIQAPGFYSFSDSVYDSPGHFEKILGAYYSFSNSNFDLVGSDSVPSQNRSSLEMIYETTSGFSTPNNYDLSASTDEFTCIGSSGSQAKTAFGTMVFGYGLNGGYFNETNSIEGATPLLFPSSYNKYFLAAGDDNYTLMGYAVGYSDSSGTDDAYLIDGQYGTKTVEMSGNQRLLSFISGDIGIEEYGAGYSDAHGTKDAFVMAFDTYSLDTTWTLTLVNPSADEKVLSLLLKDSVLFLFGNTTTGQETDIFVKKININTHTLISEYTLGASGVKDSVVGVTQNMGYDMVLLTTQGNDIHLYKLPYWNFSVVTTDISCYGNNDGTITATPDLSPGFVVSYYDSAHYQITPTNLSAGKYFIEMIDTPYYNYLLTDSVIIHEPDSLILSILSIGNVCYADSNGSVDVMVSGGTPGFSYDWIGSTGYTSNTEDISNLFPGTYSLTVTDTMGCQQTTVADVVESPAITITIDSLNNVLCNGGTNGAIYITMAGGTPGYSYSWSDTTGFSSSYEDLWNLPAGQYFLLVTDTIGCQKTDTMIISEPPVLMVVDSVYPVSCLGLFDGAINLMVSGGISPYSFNWTGSNGFSATTDSVSGLEVGNYNYTVTDVNGCMQNGGQNLTAPPPATITGILSVPSYGPVDVGDALIYLYKDTSSSGSAYQITAYDSTVVMFNGDFGFNSLYSADYYLLAKINSSESIYDYVATTYYDTVVNWFDAVPVTLQCGDDDTIQMQMIELPPLGGTGSISGYIYMNGSKSMGEPVPGAEVFAEQEPDEHPIANTQTNSSGFYHIGGLPLGSKSLFKLTVDIPGLPLMSTYAGIGLDATNDSLTDMNFVVDTTSGGGIFIDTTSQIGFHNISFVNTLSVYPNPFSKNLNIEFSTDNQANVNMEIIDISGKIVYRKDFRSIAGRNYIEINTQTKVPGNGTFFLKITSGNNVLIKKIIKR